MNDQAKCSLSEPIVLSNTKVDPFSVRGLAARLGISKSEISASLQRSQYSGFAFIDHATGGIKPNRRDLGLFIKTSLKFVFPVKAGAMIRGMPTAFSAPMLQSLLISGGEHSHVWPDANGTVTGQSIAPLFASVPTAAQNDPALYEYLALIDAIRIGRQREANLAAERLTQKLQAQ
jgi:hypothetical protein